MAATKGPRLAANLLANLAGTGAIAIGQLVSVPIFIRLLGAEAYGLIGFYATLQLSLQVLDLGLSSTLNREMARRSAQHSGIKGDPQSMRDLLRTLEAAYWVVGIAVGGAVYLGASWIAEEWIQATRMPAGEVVRCVELIGVIIAIQWGSSLYLGGLMGLQRQVMANSIRVSFVLLSIGGAIAVVTGFSRSVQAVFVWQAFACVMQTTALALALWHYMPKTPRTASINPRMLREIGAFAGGISGISLAGMILTQMDKALLSRLLPLDLFGYYTAAALLANGLRLFIGPVYSAIFPRLSSSVASQDVAGVETTYHAGTQLMATLVLPLATVLIVFAPEILQIWTADAALTSRSSSVVQFLAAGTAINGLMYMPYALQLAHGWTRLSLLVTVGMCVAMVPAVIVLTQQFGAPGAAAVWLILNVLNFAISVPLTHIRLMRGHTARWMIQDVGKPAVAGIGSVLLIAAVIPLPDSSVGIVVFLGGLVLVAMTASALSADSLRPLVLRATGIR